jgi:hypothetical protein
MIERADAQYRIFKSRGSPSLEGAQRRNSGGRDTLKLSGSKYGMAARVGGLPQQDGLLEHLSALPCALLTELYAY